MDDLLNNIAMKKAQLDQLRPTFEHALRHLQKYLSVELSGTMHRAA